jgi:hypothetical protein
MPRPEMGIPHRRMWARIPSSGRPECLLRCLNRRRGRQSETEPTYGSMRCTDTTRSIDRSNEAIFVVPVVSAHATRYASA